MSNKINANIIFSDLLDGYTAPRLAEMISHSDVNVSLDMAEKAINSFYKQSKDQTQEDNQNMLIVLHAVFDGETAYDISSDYSIDFDLAEAYIQYIKNFTNL